MSECFIFQEVRSQMFTYGTCQLSEKPSPAVWQSLLLQEAMMCLTVMLPCGCTVMVWRENPHSWMWAQGGHFLLWGSALSSVVSHQCVDELGNTSAWMNEWMNGRICQGPSKNCASRFWVASLEGSPRWEEDLDQFGSRWEGDDVLTWMMLYEESRCHVCSTQGSEVRVSQGRQSA